MTGMTRAESGARIEIRLFAAHSDRPGRRARRRAPHSPQALVVVRNRAAQLIHLEHDARRQPQHHLRRAAAVRRVGGTIVAHQAWSGGGRAAACGRPRVRAGRWDGWAPRQRSRASSARQAAACRRAAVTRERHGGGRAPSAAAPENSPNCRQFSASRSAHNSDCVPDVFVSIATAGKTLVDSTNASSIAVVSILKW